MSLFRMGNLDWSHWVVKSCTKIAYIRVLSGYLWSTVMFSPVNFVYKLLSYPSYLCIFHNLGLWESTQTNCVVHLRPWLTEDLDKMILGDHCCHFQKMLISIPTRLIWNSSIKSGKSCKRFLDDSVFSWSSCDWSRTDNTTRHSTPSSGDEGGLLVPVSGIDEAKGQVREQVGHEVIWRNRL